MSRFNTQLKSVLDEVGVRPGRCVRWVGAKSADKIEHLGSIRNEEMMRMRKKIEKLEEQVAVLDEFKRRIIKHCWRGEREDEFGTGGWDVAVWVSDLPGEFSSYVPEEVERRLQNEG